MNESELSIIFEMISSLIIIVIRNLSSSVFGILNNLDDREKN